MKNLFFLIAVVFTSASFGAVFDVTEDFNEVDQSIYISQDIEVLEFTLKSIDDFIDVPSVNLDLSADNNMISREHSRIVKRQLKQESMNLANRDRRERSTIRYLNCL
jgi:hypothetical protein